MTAPIDNVSVTFTIPRDELTRIDEAGAAIAKKTSIDMSRSELLRHLLRAAVARVLK